MIRILLATLLVALPLAAQAAEAPRTVSVQGSGTAYGKPDIASASAGIESRGATPEQALAANTKAMSAIMAAIKRHGIAENTRPFELR